MKMSYHVGGKVTQSHRREDGVLVLDEVVIDHCALGRCIGRDFLISKSCDLRCL